MPGRLNLRHGVLVGIAAFLLLFQNCSRPEDPQESSLSSTQSGAAGYISQLPSAYEAKLDTLAHMSCSNITENLPRRAYFTYRAGAYSNLSGGLTMTQAFRDATRFYNAKQRAEALQQSLANANTRLNMAIRSEANVDSIFKEGSLVVGEELESFLPPLDTAAVAGPLAGLAAGQMMNYFPGSGAQRLMEASLRFYKYENVVKDSRDRLGASDATTAAYLAMGFSSTSDEANQVLRRPLMGSGFKLSFGLPAGYSGGERRVIGSVQERSLATNQPTGSTFDCLANYQFMIIRPEDKAANRVVCNAFVDKSDNTTEEAALRALRRVLRVEDWYVDVKNHCILPRGTGDYCYGDLQGRTIQYGVSTCANTPTTMCPHFVSICIRR
jgi:hypothetical protein